MKTLPHFVLCLATAGLLLAACAGAPDAANEGPAASHFANFVSRKRAPELPSDAPALTGAILSHAASAITVRAMSGEATTEVPRSVRVRIRSTTVIYLDTTALAGADVQQTVAKVETLQALDLQSTIGSGGGAEGFVQVWGETSSGEVIATVIVVLPQRERPTVVRTIAVDGGGNSGGY